MFAAKHCMQQRTHTLGAPKKKIFAWNWKAYNKLSKIKLHTEYRHKKCIVFGSISYVLLLPQFMLLSLFSLIFETTQKYLYGELKVTKMEMVSAQSRKNGKFILWICLLNAVLFRCSNNRERKCITHTHTMSGVNRSGVGCRSAQGSVLVTNGASFHSGRKHGKSPFEMHLNC